MTVLELAKQLKEKIRDASSIENLNFLVKKLNDSKLSKDNIDFLYQYCCSNGYDEKTKSFLLCESDNSEFLKYVNYVFGKLKDEN